MSQTYIGYTFKVEPLQSGSEILIAQLGAVGFESFVETEEGVEAYIQKGEWQEDILEEIQILSSDEFKVTFQKKEIDPINWNSEWEKNFEPIEVDEICAVRAPFHRNFNVPYEIVIEPKMSFGTGHHETTFMMLQHILENDFNNKTVLDMGCGTAVLAILAHKRGASRVDAIDIDEWCVTNSIENCERNNCTEINVSLGDATSITKGKNTTEILGMYDVIIANINRNILLQDMETYVAALNDGGELYLSGFYTEDLLLIKDKCNNLRLKFVNSKNKNNWIAAKFVS